MMAWYSHPTTVVLRSEKWAEQHGSKVFWLRSPLNRWLIPCWQEVGLFAKPASPAVGHVLIVDQVMLVD